MALTFGLPDEWHNFECSHARFREGLPSLIAVCDQILTRTLESKDHEDRLVFMLGRHVPEDFTEILLLCANGYGIAAIKLLRPMFERVVTMMYLMRNPGRCTDFDDWHIVMKWKTLNHLRDEGDDPGKYLSAEELQRIESDYQRVKAPKRQQSWSKFDLKSMARQVGIEGLYLSFAHWPSLHIHTTLTGMAARVKVEKGGLVFRAGLQRHEADLALLGAHTCLLLALNEQVAHFKLGVDTGWVMKSFTDCWPGAALPGAAYSGRSVSKAGNGGA